MYSKLCLFFKTTGLGPWMITWIISMAIPILVIFLLFTGMVDWSKPQVLAFLFFPSVWLFAAFVELWVLTRPLKPVMSVSNLKCDIRASSRIGPWMITWIISMAIPTLVIFLLFTGMVDWSKPQVLAFLFFPLVWLFAAFVELWVLTRPSEPVISPFPV